MVAVCNMCWAAAVFPPLVSCEGVNFPVGMGRGKAGLNCRPLHALA